jgi:hypothetical protein
VSSIHRTTELEPATAKRKVYSPLEVYWDALLEWRRCRKLESQLYRLYDNELMDLDSRAARSTTSLRSEAS